MDLLADNDAIVKFGECRLLKDFLDCFGAESQFFVTETFHPWLRGRIKRGRVPEYVGPEFLALKPNEIELPIENSFLLELLDSPGLDAGEAVLLAASYNNNSKVLFTGDKRAIKALANHPSIDKLRAGLTGKLICIEQGVLMLIERHGFEAVRLKIVEALQVNIALDTALRVAFGSGMDATEENVVASLESYITELKVVANDLLFTPAE
jgi:hypothetical protein